jgi:hypothetical protein
VLVHPRAINHQIPPVGLTHHQILQTRPIT